MKFVKSHLLVILFFLSLVCLLFYVYLFRDFIIDFKRNSWKYQHFWKFPRYLITSYMVSAESKLAHKLLDNLHGIEIGASAHNPFGLSTINVNVDNNNTYFKREELQRAGVIAKVDVISAGDQLPFSTGSQDFVVNAHVLEHFYDPIGAIKEWLRVLKPGGIVYIIFPHKERTFDKDRARTTLGELLQRHLKKEPPVPDDLRHYTVWITQDLVELCRYFRWRILTVQDVDDKVGNGFTVVLQKT